MRKTAIFFAVIVLCLTLFGCASQSITASVGLGWKDFDYDTPLRDLVVGKPSYPDEPTLPDEPDLPPPLPTPIKDKLLLSTTNNLAIRSGAGNNFASIGVINSGDMVAFGKLENGWYRTIYKERPAYISANFVREVSFDKGNSVVESVIEVGKTLLGHPYIFGAQRYHWGNGVRNASFVAGQYDCSSLVQYMFFVGGGITMDVNTRLQVVQGETVARNDLRRGDVIFFTNASRYYNSGIERIGHVGVYLGDNYILHTASDYAVIEPMSDQRWAYYIVAKRFA
ncbi:MAG: C40 family peptidase [Clostridia bacterium]